MPKANSLQLLWSLKLIDQNYIKFCFSAAKVNVLTDKDGHTHYSDPKHLFLLQKYPETGLLFCRSNTIVFFIF